MICVTTTKCGVMTVSRFFSTCSMFVRCMTEIFEGLDEDEI